jgi:ribosomal protein S18 acetylase RimI-like enzyme
MEAEPGFWQPGWSNNTLAKGIDSAAGLAFIWEDSSEIIGFICAHNLGFRAYLSELIVAKEARGRGIGKALLEHVKNSLAQKDCALLIADVWREAVPFYKSLGWEPPDAILLRRKINIRVASE